MYEVMSDTTLFKLYSLKEIMQHVYLQTPSLLIPIVPCLSSVSAAAHLLILIHLYCSRYFCLLSPIRAIGSPEKRPKNCPKSFFFFCWSSRQKLIQSNSDLLLEVCHVQLKQDYVNFCISATSGSGRVMVKANAECDSTSRKASYSQWTESSYVSILNDGYTVISVWSSLTLANVGHYKLAVPPDQVRL